MEPKSLTEMTDTEIFSAIENETIYDLGLASGVGALEGRLERSDILKEALYRAKNYLSFAATCCSRLHYFATSKWVPEGYVHPDRHLVLAYAYLVLNANHAEGRAYIQELAKQDRPDWFWFMVIDLLRKYSAIIDETAPIFTAKVNRVSDNEAYLSLYDIKGDEYYIATIDTKTLFANGGTESDDFNVYIISSQTNAKLLKFEPIKRQQLSKKQYEELWDELDRDFSDGEEG